MCFTLNLLIFTLLSPTSSILQAKNLKEIKNQPPNEEEKSVVKFLEKSSSEDQFSLHTTTTTESTTTIETYRELTFAITDNNNISREFKPSVHLGEIKESRISSPFNNVHHIRFENEVDPVSYHQLNNLGAYQPGLQIDHQETLEAFPENVAGSLDEDRREGVQQNVFVKFQDQSVDLPKVYYEDSSRNQAYHHQLTENVGAQYDLMDQQVFQNQENPTDEQKVKNYLGKPSKFQSDAQKHEFIGFSNVDPLKNQYYPNYDQQAYQQSVHDLDAFKRPHDGAVYVQESSFTRTKKFPYPFHQPPVGYHQLEVVNDHRTSYPVRERVAPWKKILHLIGAFLPIGLLVAALTPNIVKVNNTTDPNIVLSKWRVADLPAEHKQARFDESSIICEDRLICDVILAGGEAGSNALQNILWNLATRTSTTIAKECGLQDIFEAVKKKDCTTIVC